jgi:hypothetical protein
MRNIIQVVGGLLKYFKREKYITIANTVDRSQAVYYVQKNAIVSVSTLIGNDDIKYTLLWVYGVGQIKTRTPYEEIIKQL